MENQIELPPGFRFHPTDEELITHYLLPKVYNNSFSAIPIGKVDLNKVEPWDLPWSAKMGEDEWYFFCVKDKKYPTGSRTNRATEAGYWKATGKDKEIFRAKKLIGMKKTLVFYKGRAPRGQKTNWVMHEFRLEGNNLHTTSKECVISRIFHKNSSGKKTHISKLARSCGDIKLQHSNLPCLIEISRNSIADTSHVLCISGQFEDRKPREEESFESFNPSSSVLPTSSSFETFLMQDQSIMGLLNVEEAIKKSSKTEFSHDTGGMSTDLSSNQDPITSAGLNCLWNY